MSATRQALVMVMAKMALADDTVSPEEVVFLSSLLEPGENLEELLENARTRSMAELVQPIEGYPDRFFIALRAACVAGIDEDFDPREQSAFADLVAVLGITEADQELILQGVADLGDPEATPHFRIEQLFAASSFA